jgi:hypothetical protein
MCVKTGKSTKKRPPSQHSTIYDELAREPWDRRCPTLWIMTERSNAMNMIGKNMMIPKAADGHGAGVIRVGLGKHRTERGKKHTGRGQVGGVERAANRFFQSEGGAPASPTPPSPLFPAPAGRIAPIHLLIRARTNSRGIRKRIGKRTRHLFVQHASN